MLCSIYQRTAALAKVIREAAAGDGEIADELRATRERQRRDVAVAADLIMGRAATEAEPDGLWALTSPEIYLLLVEESGWTPQQYEAWMAEALERLVPRPRPVERRLDDHEPDAPVDTRMMRIVHQALRRDLRRAQVALTSEPPPPPQQRRAVARHLTWMMAFLRAHHRSEDDGLYPLVRQRDPAAAELLDAMHADHEVVTAAISALESAAATCRQSEGAADVEPVVAALDQLDRGSSPPLAAGGGRDDARRVAGCHDREWRGWRRSTTSGRSRSSSWVSRAIG